MIEIGQRVVVTTEYRGVFFGKLAVYGQAERFVTLHDARNCVYWPSSNRGFLGLATDGPLEGSRVGPAVAEIDLAGVTSVSACSAVAVEKWQAGPWQ